MGYGSVTVDVDLEDVFNQLEDDDLRAELDSRRRRTSKHGYPYPGVISLGGPDFAEDALDALKKGRVDDAMLILERNLRPKFDTSAAVLGAYDKAMGREKKKAA